MPDPQPPTPVRGWYPFRSPRRSQVLMVPHPPKTCELCGRATKLTFHHLIPKKVHRRKRYILRHGKEVMRHLGLEICALCHRGIHTIIPLEQDLADHYHSKEQLLAHEGIARHVAWVMKQKC